VKKKEENMGNEHQGKPELHAIYGNTLLPVRNIFLTPIQHLAMHINCRDCSIWPQQVAEQPPAACVSSAQPDTATCCRMGLRKLEALLLLLLPCLPPSEEAEAIRVGF